LQAFGVDVLPIIITILILTLEPSSPAALFTTKAPYAQ